jgi:hypothetical protein
MCTDLEHRGAARALAPGERRLRVVELGLLATPVDDVGHSVSAVGLFLARFSTSLAAVALVASHQSHARTTQHVWLGRGRRDAREF